MTCHKSWERYLMLSHRAESLVRCSKLMFESQLFGQICPSHCMKKRKEKQHKTKKDLLSSACELARVTDYFQCFNRRKMSAIEVFVIKKWPCAKLMPKSAFLGNCCAVLKNRLDCTLKLISKKAPFRLHFRLKSTATEF